MKRRTRHTAIDDALMVEISTQFDLFEEHETAAVIYKNAKSLQMPYRDVFLLRVIGNLPFRQIADIYGKTESWAKITYYRAKAKIIDMIGDII